MNDKPISELTEEEFRAKVKAEAPHLLDVLAEEDDGGSGGGGLDETTVRQMFADQAQEFETKLSEAVEGRASARSTAPSPSAREPRSIGPRA